MKNTIQHPDTVKKMNPLYRFFCWAGGANTDVLDELPTEKNRFFSYGTVICTTALFAFLSSSYAFTVLLKDEIGYAAFLPAVAWGIFIFCLDRFFIVSVSNRGTFWMKLKLAWPRLLLAGFIGIIISKPLEYRIFDQEIRDELRITQNKLLADLDTLESQKKVLLEKARTKVINQLPETEEMQPLQKRYITLVEDLAIKDSAIFARTDSVAYETDGKGKSRLVGYGTNAKLHRAFRDSLVAQKNLLKLDTSSTRIRIDAIDARRQVKINGYIQNNHQQALAKLATEMDLQRKQLLENYQPSILNQEVALGNISKKDQTASHAILFVTLLFIFIEMAPMILKLMTKPGAYENRIMQIESSYSTEDRLRRSLDMEEYKSNRGLVRHLAHSQREIIKTAMSGWHEEQINKANNDPDYHNDMFNNSHDN
ncbi:DUF4407 domain-containing protein [Chitinophaga sp. S165]|uniref:DUF4407 domain-containing protein n=1 Tax=Chitinophaga sp. S165 TaxID=2135462 RepID=UPI000D81AECA|nr:DUF4407 domain-containing protein [Chitinophaga sp. S165]PWV45822.1 uncharacterized protein DUF4407 [Chitinophaga sp. S165]